MLRLKYLIVAVGGRGGEHVNTQEFHSPPPPPGERAPGARGSRLGVLGPKPGAWGPGPGGVDLLMR